VPEVQSRKNKVSEDMSNSYTCCHLVIICCAFIEIFVDSLRQTDMTGCEIGEIRAYYSIMINLFSKVSRLPVSSLV
jgi:hypothetical protein